MLRSILAITFFCVAACNGQASLPQFNIDPNSITVSGISSGACFATQFHIAYSRQVHGSGTWAGVPYVCYSQNALYCMETPSIVNVDGLIRDAENLASDGKIDLLANLADDRVYIHHGTADTVVRPAAADKMAEFWNHFIPDTSRVVLKNDLGASHAIVSDHVGTACGVSDNRLFIENCNVNTVFSVVNHLNGGGLNGPNTPGSMAGRILEFGQDEFFGGNADGASMATTGYVYIPPACEGGANRCKLHIFFHGCGQMSENVGTEVVRTAGFIEIADANDMVVIFPQTIAKPLTGNPYGCYNWFGYLNDLLLKQYATKEGPQMDGCHRMMARAAGL